MQITPIRIVLLRRSPTSDLSPLPLELVTVTTSSTSPRSKSSSLLDPTGSGSGSSPRRRRSGGESSNPASEDLSYLGKFHKAINHSSSNNSSSSSSNDGLTNGMSNSIKITSIPVNGGCINISHDASSSSSPSSAMKLLPIKTEPAN